MGLVENGQIAVNDGFDLFKHNAVILGDMGNLDSAGGRLAVQEPVAIAFTPTAFDDATQNVFAAVVTADNNMGRPPAVMRNYVGIAPTLERQRLAITFLMAVIENRLPGLLGSQLLIHKIVLPSRLDVFAGSAQPGLFLAVIVRDGCDIDWNDWHVQYTIVVSSIDLSIGRMDEMMVDLAAKPLPLDPLTTPGRLSQPPNYKRKYVLVTPLQHDDVADWPAQP